MKDLINRICVAFVRNGTDHPAMSGLLSELVTETQESDFRYNTKFSAKERADNARALAEEQATEAARLRALNPEPPKPVKKKAKVAKEV